MSYVPLLLLGGAAVVIIGGKKKKKSSVSTSTSVCESPVTISKDSIPMVAVPYLWDSGEEHSSGEPIIMEYEQDVPKVAYDEVKGGNRNIVDITKKTLAHLIPGSCVGYPSIVVNVLPEVAGGHTWKHSAPEFFYRQGESIIYLLNVVGAISDQEADQFAEVLKKWWHDHMGDAHTPAD